MTEVVDLLACMLLTTGISTLASSENIGALEGWLVGAKVGSSVLGNKVGSHVGSEELGVNVGKGTVGE